MLMYPRAPFATVGPDAFDDQDSADCAKPYTSLFPAAVTPTFPNSQQPDRFFDQAACVHSYGEYWPACCCPSCRQQGLVMSSIPFQQPHHLSATSTPAVSSPADISNNGYATPVTQSPVRDSSAAGSTPEAGYGKPKQKRNKPTLSCEECVERKTKVSSSNLRG